MRIVLSVLGLLLASAPQAALGWERGGYGYGHGGHGYDGYSRGYGFSRGHRSCCERFSRRYEGRSRYARPGPRNSFGGGPGDVLPYAGPRYVPQYGAPGHVPQYGGSSATIR